MLAVIVVIVVGVTGFIGSAKEKRRSLPEHDRLRLLLLNGRASCERPSQR